MTLNKTIDLVKDMLDITLDLQLSYIQDIHDNIGNLSTSLPPILTINKNYFDNFVSIMTNSKFKNIYSIIDSVFANYIIICLDDKRKDYVLLGPYMYTKPSDDVLLTDFEYNFTPDEIKALKKYYKSIPIISRHKMTNIIKTFLKSIYGEDCKFEYIEKKNLNNLKTHKAKDSNIFIELLESQSLEKNSIAEYKLFLATRKGDKFLASRCMDKLLPHTNINSNEFDNIRDYKNKLIYYNGLLKKATEIESVPIVYIESLYNTYLSKIEQLNDFNELYNLVSPMILDYCASVTQYKLKGYSPLVRKAMNHIILNLQNELTVQNIANLFYVSPTYLSRLFKKEINCSVIEYINKQRIKRSTFLLKDTDLPIHNISTIVGINDLNYFSRLFKKYIGNTPSQYRKENS